MKYLTEPIERLSRALRVKPAAPAQGSSHGLGLWWTFSAGLVVAAALVVAIVQNSHQVKLNYLAWHASVSLIAVLLTTALSAVFLAEVGGLIWRRRRRSRLGRHSELETLRSQQQSTGDVPPVAAPAALS